MAISMSLVPAFPKQLGSKIYWKLPLRTIIFSSSKFSQSFTLNIQQSEYCKIKTTTQTYQLLQLQSIWSTSFILCAPNHSLEELFSQTVARLQGKERIAFHTTDHLCEHRFFCLHILHSFSQLRFSNTTDLCQRQTISAQRKYFSNTVARL